MYFFINHFIFFIMTYQLMSLKTGLVKNNLPILNFSFSYK